VCHAGSGGHGEEGGRAWSPVCAKPDPVGKSAISGVCHAGSGGHGGERGRARSSMGGEGGPRWGREFAERATARLAEHGERAGDGNRRASRRGGRGCAEAEPCTTAVLWTPTLHS
jgi:hypothetical protein